MRSITTFPGVLMILALSQQTSDSSTLEFLNQKFHCRACSSFNTLEVPTCRGNH